MYELIGQIIAILKAIVASNNPVTVTKAERFSDDQIFDFTQRCPKGKGVRSVSIRNIGDYTLVVTDVFEPIKPGEAFVLSDMLCANKNFEVRFENNPSPNGNNPIPANPIKDAVLRYNVDVY